MGDARTLHSTSVDAASNNSGTAARFSEGPTPDEAICALASFLLEKGLVSLGGAAGNRQLWFSGSTGSGKGPAEPRAGATALLTAAQAAAVLGISPRTLSGWRTRGGGPRFLKLGRAGRTSPVRYSRAALEKYQSERERRSTSDTGSEGTKGAAK